jgi:hypothetical protein
MTFEIFVALGGVGIFLIGMVILTDGLKHLSGAAIRRFLARNNQTPLNPDISPGRAIGADCRLVWGAGALCARRHGRLSSAS